MPYEYNKLRGRIVEKFGSQDKFAEILGCSSVTLSRKMNCASGFSQQDIIKWSELLNIDKSDYGAYFFN